MQDQDTSQVLLYSKKMHSAMSAQYKRMAEEQAGVHKHPKTSPTTSST